MVSGIKRCHPSFQFGQKFYVLPDCAPLISYLVPSISVVKNASHRLSRLHMFISQYNYEKENGKEIYVDCYHRWNHHFCLERIKLIQTMILAFHTCLNLTNGTLQMVMNYQERYLWLLLLNLSEIVVYTIFCTTGPIKMSLKNSITNLCSSDIC